MFYIFKLLLFQLLCLLKTFLRVIIVWKAFIHLVRILKVLLYEGGSYKVNAMSFPDEDGDRLFIIIPKQAAWLGGMVDLVEKDNEGLKLDAAQIAALEKEFMDTFETFTVILSLSKK